MTMRMRETYYDFIVGGKSYNSVDGPTEATLEYGAAVVEYELNKSATFVVDVPDKVCIFYKSYFNTCIKNYAYGLKKPDLCDKIVESVEKKYFCIEHIAAFQKDPSLCSRVVQPKEYCAADTVIEKNDISLCDKLLTGDYIYKCFQTISKREINACQSLQPLSKNHCESAVKSPYSY